MLSDLLSVEPPAVLAMPWDERRLFALLIGDLFSGEVRVVLSCFGGLGIAFLRASPFESLVGLALAFLPLAVIGVFPGAERCRVFDLGGLFDGRPRFGELGVVASSSALPSLLESLVGLASAFILLAGLGDFAGLPTFDLVGLCDGCAFAGEVFVGEKRALLPRLGLLGVVFRGLLLPPFESLRGLA